MLKSTKMKLLIATIKEEVVGFAVMELYESLSLVPRKYAYMKNSIICKFL